MFGILADCLWVAARANAWSPVPAEGFGGLPAMGGRPGSAIRLREAILLREEGRRQERMEERTMMHVRQDDFGFEAATAGGRDGFLRRALAGLRAGFADRARRRADRRASRQLAVMDEHLLRDIGVTREEAMRLALGEDD